MFGTIIFINKFVAVHREIRISQWFPLGKSTSLACFCFPAVAAIQAWPVALATVIPHLEHIDSSVQVAGDAWCSSAIPSILPQREHIFGSVQVASFQSCPNASPSISPHSVQVLGAVQVASRHVCLCPHAHSVNAIVNASARATTFFISLYLSFILLHAFFEKTKKCAAEAAHEKRTAPIAATQFNPHKSVQRREPAFLPTGISSQVFLCAIRTCVLLMQYHFPRCRASIIL